MTNYVGIRLLPCAFGSIEETFERLKKLGNLTIFQEEMPYIHYHILLKTDKSVKQVKKWIYNNKLKNIMTRTRNNIWVDMVDNLDAYKSYIGKCDSKSLNNI
jgi:hypothetical protein